MRLSLRLRDDEGNVLVSVTIVSMLVGVLASLVLATGQRADTDSVGDANHETALGVAEAGLHEAIAKIEAQAAGSFLAAFSFSGATPQGPYEVGVTRSGQGFVIDSTGTAGGDALGRTRRIRATLRPPRLFGEDEGFALFSESYIELKNNNSITGNVWSNGSVLASQNATLEGSITAAQGWVRLDKDVRVSDNVWSGGYNAADGWAISLDTNTTVGGWAKASVAAPSDSLTCGGETPDNYNVSMANGSAVTGNVTTLGGVVGLGSATVGSVTAGACTPASAARPLPTFTFNRNNYDPATYHEFSSVSDFQYWLNNPAGNGDALEGTFVIQDLEPSQANRVDLSGTSIVGDTTIITNAPVFTNQIADNSAADQASFVLVSNYDPPTGTACNVNVDSSECAIHVKNDFDLSCRTAVLLYADLGPIAVKNNQRMCGAILAEAILIKNNQSLSVDARVDRMIGFGAQTYEIALWEELPL
jgi:hypothetical protein